MTFAEYYAMQCEPLPATPAPKPVYVFTGVDDDGMACYED